MQGFKEVQVLRIVKSKRTVPTRRVKTGTGLLGAEISIVEMDQIKSGTWSV